MQDLAGDRAARIGDRRLDLAAPAEAIRGIDRDSYAVKFAGFEIFQREFILLGARRKRARGQAEAQAKKGCQDFQCQIGFHKADCRSHLENFNLFSNAAIPVEPRERIDERKTCHEFHELIRNPELRRQDVFV